jgi:hypothetical protein
MRTAFGSARESTPSHSATEAAAANKTPGPSHRMDLILGQVGSRPSHLAPHIDREHRVGDGRPRHWLDKAGPAQPGDSCTRWDRPDCLEASAAGPEGPEEEDQFDVLG